jgi:hypothetical protein
LRDKIFDGAPAGSIEFTSPADDFYNCVAWAVANDTDVIWPDEDEQWGWPPSIERSEKLAAVESFFALMGFVKCGIDTAYREGTEKIALYAKAGNVKHVARQLQVAPFKGYWTSKLGPGTDIRHRTAEVLECETYGAVASVLYRAFDGTPPRIPELHPPRARLVSPTGKPLVR